MLDSDLARRIELERKDAERTLLDRVIALLKAEGVNTAYRQAYKRAIKKIAEQLDMNRI